VELRREGLLNKEAKFGATARDRHIVPARLRRDVARIVEEAVLSLHEVVGCVGLTRTDILVLEDGEIVILELNGIPGLLQSSIACDAALAAGISFDELAVRYAESAYLERAEPRIWADQC
jgi:D-alanine-D-alanine ligase